MTLERIGAAFIMVAACRVVTAHAADIPFPVRPAPPPPPAWTYTIAPYFWATGMNGTIAQFGSPPVNVDISFSQVLDALQFGGMVAGEARNGRWGIATDLFFAKLHRDVPGPGPLGVSVGLTSSALSGAILAQYRIHDYPGASLDLMAGARVWDIQSQLAFHNGPFDGKTFEDGRTWVDPMIGVKGTYDLPHNFYLTGWGMIGGFGAASRIDWDLMGAVGYNVNQHFSLIAGYRAIGVDYSNDGFVFDVVQHGPLLGAAFHF